MTRTTLFLLIIRAPAVVAAIVAIAALALGAWSVAVPAAWFVAGWAVLVQGAALWFDAPLARWLNG